MATAEEIAALRLLIAEAEDVAPYDDMTLSDRLDATPNAFTVAYDIWTEKAASSAALVNISEGGSSRAMGDLYEQALKMAEQMRTRALAATQPPDGFGAGVRVRKLARP